MAHLMLKDCEFSFDQEAEPLVPAMALEIEPCCRRGVIAKFIRKLTLDHVKMDGIRGERLDLQDVEITADQ